MEAVAVVTVLVLAQYMFFGAKVGPARGKYDVKAPAISGNTDFERIFRVHQNTLEQLVVFLPSLWMFAHYVHALGAAALGVVFLVARFIYFKAYIEDPAKRGPGFITGYIATALLLLGGLGGAIWSWLQ